MHTYPDCPLNSVSTSGPCGRICLKMNANTARKIPTPIAAPYAAIPASAMVQLMQDQINNLVNNVNLSSNWDKMYTAEAKVGKMMECLVKTNSRPIESCLKFAIFPFWMKHASALIIKLIFGI